MVEYFSQLMKEQMYCTVLVVNFDNPLIFYKSTQQIMEDE